MRTPIYDPTLVGGDAFDMDNMAESSTKKILTSDERIKLGTIAEGAEVNPNELSGKETVFSGNVITETRADGSTLVTTFNGDGTITEKLTVGLDVFTKKQHLTQMEALVR